MTKIALYHNERINSFDELQELELFCNDPPDKTCVCPHCYRIEITIDEISSGSFGRTGRSTEYTGESIIEKLRRRLKEHGDIEIDNE